MSEKYISLAEVKNILAEEQEKRLERLEPQNEILEQNVFDQSTRAAMDHSQQVTRISAEQSRELIEKALGLNCVKGSEFIACKIADILPEYPVDVRAIFSKERVALEQSDIEEILDLVNNYL